MLRTWNCAASFFSQYSCLIYTDNPSGVRVCRPANTNWAAVVYVSGWSGSEIDFVTATLSAVVIMF